MFESSADRSGIDQDFVLEQITTPAATFLPGCEQSHDGWREFGCACASPAYMDPAPPDDVAENGQAGSAADIANHVGQLDVHLSQGLLHMLNTRRGCRQIFPLS